MADRVRAFQDVQLLKSQAAALNLAPRVLTQAQESGIFESQGRRETPSFAPPAGRASRDGNEGFRGDGRPPVASVFYKRPPPCKEVLDPRNMPKTIPVRPATAMVEAASAHFTRHGPSKSADTHQLHERHQSIEHAADPAQEIAAARARLRSVIKERNLDENQPRERAPTLAELNDMLDDAIGNNGTQPQAFSDEDVDAITPTPALISRPNTSHTICRQPQSRGRESRRSIDSLRPRSSEDSGRVDYDGQPPAETTRRTTEHSRDQDSASSSSQARKSLDIISSETLPPPTQPVPRVREISPVKQRAAIFESLNRNPKEYVEGHGIAQPEQDAKNGKKKMHKIKFGEMIEERPGTPLIPLTLPAMVKDQQGSAKETPIPEQDPPQDALGHDPGQDIIEQGKQRESSFSWPFKWGIFGKTATASSQEAKHSDEAKMDNPPLTKASLVRSRVYDLMQAANDKEDAEKRRRHAERERLSRRQNRPPITVKEYELKEDKVDLEDLKPSQLPPLQVPVDEEAEGLKLPTKQDDVLSEPRTPLQRAMTEKQVLSPPSERDGPSELSSPTRSVPRTPIRGRLRKSGHRPSISEQHGIEQQFKLSPGPSRSVSRSGRAGVKVEVEVRDSPEREARERGEKIVIIRADLEAAEVPN